MNQFKRHLSAPSTFAKIYISGPIDVIKMRKGFRKKREFIVI